MSKLKALLTHCSLLIAVLLFSSLLSFAAPGSLDTTFGTGGKVTTEEIRNNSDH